MLSSTLFLSYIQRCEQLMDARLNYVTTFKVRTES